jgi:ankyrin repeat protein/catechol 2,3-dioxygenase-like lactoylglutathione lyase family enzyme
MSLRELPARPNLEHLKNQARKLLRERLAADDSATLRFSTMGVTGENPKLSDALHVIAREYGFDTWPELKLHIGVRSGDPVEALAAAIRGNNASLVREVLARHPQLKSSINEPSQHYAFDAPAIIAAVHRENREVIDALLDAGANINERSRWWAGGFGVLDSANPQLATYLISRGATVDIHSAARLGMIGRVRELLAADPQLVHARLGDGQLPLHFASTVEIAALLLDDGADVDARDIDHESTAAQYMASSKYYMDSQATYRHDVARFLISRGAQADILMASAIGDIALVERILDDNPETIRVTVSERYFPKRDPESGGSIYLYGFGITKSPHIIAHQFGHTAVFELLMQRSAPWLRLVQAAEIGDEARVERILQQHPSTIAQLSSNAARRVIGVAVRNNAGAVERLLKVGWPSNAVLENNQTALHYAAWHGNLAMVRTLIAHQAPINIFESTYGGSPLAWALHGSLHSWERDKGDYGGVTRELLAAGAEIPKPDRPLEATEGVLEIIQSAEQQRTAERHATKTRGVSPAVTRIILYVKDLPKVAEFYQRHFGMKPLPSKEPGWLELESGSGGCTIALHQAASTQKSGAAMKVVFGVANVRQFIKEREADGLKFGPVHAPGTFEFANVEDPAGNSISISSRGLGWASST